ncbi:glycosyltransferase family 4 protein [Pseudarthrobacter sp. J64]|uniref:glycosyltransferase family 4 protein n=1 Tax=Pseudarthrobacter sp. J64 TaxID=3116485 RepID=UPI002E81BA66|nr:glycosyltransferase family 4 protein [Pseudarthrobacter sp. J64]MEE2568493.1 glycosyltransferase family 4 protein [Pseudarthrobacter sp. J64]
MNQLLTNLRLAAGTAGQHLTDDPALLILQIARRLPARVVQPLATLAVRGYGASSTAVPALLAELIRGAEANVVRRLEDAVEGGHLAPDHARSLADIALVANRPDVADALLSRSVGASRLSAVKARRSWYSGDVTAAVGQLESAAGGAEGRQRASLSAELRILEGWRPRIASVGYAPRAKHVLHVLTNSLPHTSSGYAQRSHSILSAQRNAGWEVLAVTRIGYPVQVGKLMARSEDIVDGITYRRMLPPRLAATMDGRLQQQAEELLAVALDFRPSVLHTTTHYVNALVVRAVAEALGIPWVYEVRGQLADTWAATREPGALLSERYRLFKEREGEAMRAANLVVTLGRAMKENIIASGVPERDVLVAPNAVGGEFLKEPMAPADARSALGLDPDIQLIGTVSSLVGYEGLDDLVEAFALLAPKYPGLKLLIVGDGAVLPELKEQAKAAGLTSRVIFPGRVPRSLAYLYHQALDIFVVPRKDLAVTRDVTPLKPVEAMAAARPVVASRLPALSEIVEDGDTGLFCSSQSPVDMAAKLDALLANDQDRVRMGYNGRQTVLRSRTWTENARSVSAAYERIMEQHR